MVKTNDSDDYNKYNFCNMFLILQMRVGVGWWTFILYYYKIRSRKMYIAIENQTQWCFWRWEISYWYNWWIKTIAIVPFLTNGVWDLGGVIFLFSMIGQYFGGYLPFLGRGVVSLEGVGLGNHVWPVLQGTNRRPLFGGKHVVPRYLLVRSDIEE